MKILIELEVEPLVDKKELLETLEYSLDMALKIDYEEEGLIKENYKIRINEWKEWK